MVAKGESRVGRGHELAIVMRKSYWLMHRRTEECFRAASVTAEQFVVLSILVEFGPMNQRQLADRASTDPNTLRAILKLLEARELINRQLDPNDGRAWIVQTTKSGRALYRKLWASSEPLRQSWLDSYHQSRWNRSSSFWMLLQNAMSRGR